MNETCNLIMRQLDYYTDRIYHFTHTVPDAELSEFFHNQAESLLEFDKDLEIMTVRYMGNHSPKLSEDGDMYDFLELSYIDSYLKDRILAVASIDDVVEIAKEYGYSLIPNNMLRMLVWQIQESGTGGEDISI